ncbi:MAG: sce7726 family protein [Enterococcus casseliflavus]|nr:sce7726 family protein [Enterococcus casseliflavus]
MERIELTILSRLFSKNTIIEILENGKSTSLNRAIEYFNIPTNMSNGEIFSFCYKLLDKNYRNEYFYKNTLLNKTVFGVNSPNTATALAEFNIYKSKADFILLNNKKAEVFEIKTELDNLERVALQIEDYYKIFSYVSIVTSESNYYKTYQLFKGSTVGIKVLNNRNNLTIKKEPIFNDYELDSEAMFKSLRKNEFESILQKYYGKLPDVTQFQYYKESLKWFEKLDTQYLQQLTVNILKKRNKIIETNDLLEIPMELKYLIYFSVLTSRDIKKITIFLKEKNFF